MSHFTKLVMIGCLVAFASAGNLRSTLEEDAAEMTVEERKLVASAIWNCGWVCTNPWSAEDSCWSCLDGHLGTAQLPISYSVDMLAFKLGTGYIKGWCGTGAGVDTNTHKSGWISQGNGKYTGCEVAKDFPGLGSTSYQLNSYVKEEMKSLPEKQYNGEVWRGSELGFIISNPIFWPETGALGLGVTVEQHLFIRPILDQIFGDNGWWSKAQIDRSVDEFFAGRQSIAVQADLKAWIVKMICQIALDWTPSEAELYEFVDLQGKFTTYSTISQLFPDSISNFFFGSTVDGLVSFRSKILPKVRSKFSAQLAAGNGKCGQYPVNGQLRELDCAVLLTSGIVDVLLAAGGLSVPGAISTGLWVLYGKTSDSSYAKYDHPFTGAQFNGGFKLADHDPALFMYESMRFFAPVVGFPWWTTAPTAKDQSRIAEDRSQYSDGAVREVLNLALADRDPNAWGSDGHKFRVRSASEYRDHFVGFADFAENKNVANGAMNRKCPAKSFAIQIGASFFSKFQQSGWMTTDSPKYSEVTPFIDEFTLHKVNPGYCACKSWWCSVNCGSIKAKGPCEAKRNWWIYQCNWKN